MPTDDAVLAELNASSEGYRDPLGAIDWKALSLENWWLPQACLSLAGLPAFEALPETLRRRLSQYELLHFLHVGLWLERLFMARTVQTLSGTITPAEYAGRLHLIREEAGHSLMFLKLMDVSRLYLPPRAFRPPALAEMLGRHAPAGSLLFRLAVVIGEEVPDKFNRRIHAQAADIDPVVAAVCRLHRMDEARHIARARHALGEDLHTLGRLRRRLLGRVVTALLGQLAQAVFLPKAELYELAGLTPGRVWRRAARANPARRAFMESCVAPTRRWLHRQGLVRSG